MRRRSFVPLSMLVACWASLAAAGEVAQEKKPDVSVLDGQP